MGKQIEAYWRSNLQIIYLSFDKIQSKQTGEVSVYLSTTDQPLRFCIQCSVKVATLYGKFYNTYRWRNNRIVQKLNYSASIRRNRRLVAAVHSLRSIFVAFYIYNFKRVFKNNANPLSFVGISNCMIKFAPSVWQII